MWNKLKCVQYSVLYSFKSFCIGLFIYQIFFVCLDSYIYQRPVTKTIKRRQERYPLPMICISAVGFDYSGFKVPVNITIKDYFKGQWQLGNLSEEESFNLFAPKFFNLIRKCSDEYKQIHKRAAMQLNVCILQKYIVIKIKEDTESHD